MTARHLIIIAAVSALVSVIMGAFTAHGLPHWVEPEELMRAQQWLSTGAQYQMYHALALLAIGILLQLKPEYSGLKASALAFILGSLLFSVSLYSLALGAPRWLGAITPIGGSCLLLGWLLVAISAWRYNK